MIKTNNIKEKINENRSLINIIVACLVFIIFFYIINATYYTSFDILSHDLGAISTLYIHFSVSSHPLYHISIATLYSFLNGVLSLPHISLIFLALVQVIQYIFVEKFFYKYTQDYTKSTIFSLIFLILGSVYNPITGCFMQNQWGPNLFNNATYILMRTIIVIFLIYFWEYYKSKDNNPLKGIGLSIIFAAATLAKPTATLLILPIFFILFCHNIYKKDFSKVLKIIYITILPILFIGLSYLSLFGAESNSGLAIQPLKIWFERGVPVPELLTPIFNNHTKWFNLTVLPISLILTTLAPLTLLIIKLKNKTKISIEFKTAWIMALLGILSYLTFTETGLRAIHANFKWTIVSGIMILYLFSFYEFFTSKWTKKQKYLLLTILTLHIISSIIYILLLFTGLTATGY